MSATEHNVWGSDKLYGPAVANGHRLKVLDTRGLTDGDWIAVERVNRAYEAGGIEAFCNELEQLDDEVLQVTVSGAFFPDLIRALLEDQMIQHGLTTQDLQEILRKAESPAA